VLVSAFWFGSMLTTPEDDFRSTGNRGNLWIPSSDIFRFRPAETFASKLSKTALDLQETQPTFVPKFINLRKTCLEHTENKLRYIEKSLGDIQDENTRSETLDEAVVLLKQLGELGRALLFSMSIAHIFHPLDEEIKGELIRHQLEDPSYAENSGVDVVHFALGDRAGDKQGQWIMITQPWGKDAKSIIEQDHGKLAKLYRMQMEVRLARIYPSSSI
jgi:hypothetical protein